MNDQQAGSGEPLLAIQRLFFEVLGHPEAERDAVLATLCDGDAWLHSTLEALLQADEERDGLLDAAPWSAEQLESRFSASPALDPLAQPGAQIGRYELIEPIGRGGMGVVWRARRSDHHADRVVAIKFIPAGLDSPRALRRFRREERALARLEHPNIARLYDGGTTSQGRPYLVMEYIEGAPITEYCRRHELTIAERLKLMTLVCEATQYAHGNLVLHRDLKPSNILITPGGVPKLLDFGIAKILDDQDDATGNATMTDPRALTPRYASPEQVQGAPLTVATDVYSLGVILYELLVGRTPYGIENENRIQLERAILESEATRPSAAVLADEQIPAARRRSWSRQLRGDLDAICLAALHKSPSRRYRSVFELRDDISRHLQGAPLQAKPPGPITRLMRIIRRRRSSIAATILGASIGLGLAALYVVRAFYVPEWQEEYIRRARLAIIGELGNSSIYTLIFNADLRWSPERISIPSGEAVRRRSAASDYVAAMNLGAVPEKVAAEAMVARLAEAARGSAEEPLAVLGEFPQRYRLTRAYAEKLFRDRDRLALSDFELTRADIEDLRALGLFSLYVEDMQTTIDAWTRVPLTEPDPLVECLLGYVHLALDEGALAYARLLSAYRAYPESGTISLYLADAAARCGDVRHAEYYLNVSQRLGDRDENFAHERVQMLIYFAKGDEDAAVELLCSEFCGRSAVAELQFARYMERTHGLESALRAISGRINRRMAGYFERAPWEYYIALMEAWWFLSEPSDRRALVEAVGEHPSMTIDEFHDLLRRYQYALDNMNALGATAPASVKGNLRCDGWSQLARPISADSHDQARSELVALTDRVQGLVLRNYCAQQCRPWPQAQAAERDVLNAP